MSLVLKWGPRDGSTARKALMASYKPDMRKPLLWCVSGVKAQEDLLEQRVPTMM